MLLSICVYTSLAAVLFALGWHVGQREERLKAVTGQALPFWSWEIVASVIVFAAVAGARYHTGYDHASYLEQYQTYQRYGFFTRDFELGFVWITRFFAGLRIHYFFYFALWAALQAIFLSYACRHDKGLIPWMWLNVVLGSFFIYLMNTMREGLVACVFIALVPLIAQKRFFRFAVIAILASLIHKSGLMMVLFFALGLLRMGESVRSRWMLLGVLAAVVMLGIRPLWLSWLLRETGQWGLFAQQYRHIIDPLVAGEYGSHTWGPTRISMLTLNIMVIWNYPNMRQFFQKDMMLPVFFALFMAYCVVYYLTINAHHLFFRPFDCLMMCRLMMYSYLGMFLFRSRRWIPLAAYALLNFSYIYMSIARAAITGTHVHQQVLYHFFFA